MATEAVARRFGSNLRSCRRRAGLSQEETAIRGSLHRTEIGLLERGERCPKLDTVIKLAGAVDADFGDLVSGIEWVPGTARAGQFAVEAQAATLAREAREELEERDRRIDAQLRGAER